MRFYCSNKMVRGIIVLLVNSVAVAALAADDKKPEENKKPAIKMISPLGAAAGTTAKFMIRGLLLTDAKSVTAENGSIHAKVISSTKAAPPEKLKADQVGDTELEPELIIPETVPPGRMMIVVNTPAGDTPPFPIWIAERGQLLSESEPNGGFREAQPVLPGQAVDGLIHEAKDVDVFALRGNPGQRIALEVVATASGSLLDPVLTVYNEQGHVLAKVDDVSGSRDPACEFQMPVSGGTALVVIVDSLDRGGSMYAYRLTTRVKP